MTQREKLMRATMMAQAVKSVAKRLEFDARDFDCYFLLNITRELNNLADGFLKLK